MAQTAGATKHTLGMFLPTEQRNSLSTALHELQAEEILDLINDEDSFAVSEAKRVIPKTAELVRVAIDCISSGGSVHYFGAGTSGRIATQDAAELYPTFHTPPEVVQAHMAGGVDALLTSVENAEDDVAAGASDASGLGPRDLAIGLAASGRTPYVGGALEKARANGAKTAIIACVPEPTLAQYADIVIAGDTGPEILTGSTRLKAGTFQKVLLSGFSTAVMVGLGRTYSNLMVSMVATNEKLHSRSIRILMEGSGLSQEKAVELFEQCSGDLKLALVCGISKTTPDFARPYLSAAGDVVHRALESITNKTE